MRTLLAAIIGGVALAGVLVSSPLRAECPATPSCSAEHGRWLPRGRMSWHLDHGEAFAQGKPVGRGEQVVILPIHVVEKARARAAADGRPDPVADLKCKQRRKLVCYTNCGAYEPAQWNEALLEPVRDRLLGGPMAGYPLERWMDIRQIELLRPLIRDKFDRAVANGCEAVVCDNTEAWITGTDGRDAEALATWRAEGADGVRRLAARTVRANTGLDIGYDDQIRFNRLLADEAHARCLSIGLINDVFQIAALADDFDFALNEQCHQCGWCDLYRPFVAAGKPVLNLEFRDNEGFCGPGSQPMQRICRANRQHGLTTFSTVKRQASSKLNLPDRPQVCR